MSGLLRSVWRIIGTRRFILAMVIVVCGLLVAFNQFRKFMIGEFFANMPVQTITVSAATVSPSTWTPEIDAIGTLSAIQGVDVSTQVAGLVKLIAFAANDHVQKDQLLIQIDDAVERADLMSADAALSRDRAQMERAERLRKTGVSSEATLEEAQSTLATSQSAMARIQAVIDQKAIEAPFSGTIGIPRIEVGQYIQPGTMIATLQQLDTMRADFTVPEQQVGDLKLGQEASFGLSENEFPYKGRIIGVDPKIDPQTRLISVRAEVENPDGALRPGQFVRVRVALPAVENVIALPQTAVVTSLYGDYIYLVEQASADQAPAATETPPAAPAETSAPAETPPPAAEGDDALRESIPAETSSTTPPAAPVEGEKLVAKQVFVQIGRRQGNFVEIVKGVEPGQTVVTSGQNKLANNTPIAINNEVDPAKLALENGAPAQ